MGGKRKKKKKKKRSNNDPLCLPPDQGGPWLLYTQGNDGNSRKIQSFCTINSKELYVKSIPELRGKSILASSHGWLILHETRRCREIFSLWNPVTLQTLHLPPLIDAPIEYGGPSVYILSCTLTDDANRPNCALVLFLKGYVCYCCPRRPRLYFSESIDGWAIYALGFEENQQNINVYKVVTLNGRMIYAWATIETLLGGGGGGGGGHFSTRLVSMEFVDDRLTLLTSLQLSPPLMRFPDIRRVIYLVESCGRIYSVFVNHEDKRISPIEVWELDLEEMNWVVFNNGLNGRTFFLGHNNISTWCWGSISSKNRCRESRGVEGNCVYFVNPFGSVKSLYSYNLQDRSLTLLLPCPNLVSPWERIVWVMPQYHQSLLAEAQWEQRIRILDVIHQAKGVSSTTEYKYELPPENMNETLENNLFFELPMQIIKVILEHMNLLDYWNFRATCKLFQSVVPHPHQWRSADNLRSPLFIFHEGADELCQVLNPCRDDSRTINLQLPLDFFTIDFSKDGWLLVRVRLKYLYLYNPFTRVRGEFVPCEFRNRLASIGFSTCPTSPDCLVVGIIKSANDHCVVIYYLRYGDDTWSHFEFHHDDGIVFLPGSASPVYHREGFYFLDKTGYLGVFELVAGQETWRVCEKPHMLDDSLYSCHLVECDGELLLVFLGDRGTWVKVFSFNSSKKNWVEEKSLGNHSLFIAPSSSFSVVTTKWGMENRIYLSRLRENSIIFYSLDTHKYHVFGSEEVVEDFYDTTEPLHCCWI